MGQVSDSVFDVVPSNFYVNPACPGRGTPASGGTLAVKVGVILLNLWSSGGRVKKRAVKSEGLTAR